MNSENIKHAYQNGKIDSKEIAKSSRLTVREDKIELATGAHKHFHVVTHPGACAVIPLDAEGNLIFVKQYRHACEEILIEIPAGLIENGEDPLLCARRELREEIGHDAKHFEKVLEIYTAPGFTNEKLHIFLATDLFESPLRAEDSDEIDRIRLSIDDALKMIEDGKITDAKTIIAVYFVQRSKLG